MPWLFALEAGFNLGDFHVAETIANAIEVLAIIAIAASVLVAILGAIAVGVRFSWATGFITFKKSMGRGLLIGLDLLIAGDIIKTVTLERTIENATVLGLLSPDPNVPELGHHSRSRRTLALATRSQGIERRRWVAGTPRV